MKKLISFLFISSSLALGGEGSIYSQYGIGEIFTGSGGKNFGMGRTGVGMLSVSFINLINPAATANISRTIINASYRFTNYNSEDATGTSKIYMGNIGEVGLAFPIYSPKKMVLTLGVLPFSTVGYDQRVNVDAPIAHTEQFEGRGGLSSPQLSLSYSPSHDIFVGITGHYLFGSINRDQSLRFSSSNYYGGSYNQTLSLGGFAATIGGIYTGIEKALGLSNSDNMNLGVTFFTGSSLNSDEEILRNFSSNQDTVTRNNKTVSVPPGFSLGISYLNRDILYAADVAFQNWNSYKVDGIHPAEIQNSFQFGAGIEFLQSDNIADSFWERISFQLGGYYRKSNLVINGNSINEMYVTGGTGFPFSFDSRMNLGLEFGVRGTASSSLVKDTIIRFTVSLIASEMMFMPPPID